MFVLNVLATFLSGYYNRNAKVKELLEAYNDEFRDADTIISLLNDVAIYVNNMELGPRSIWHNKANFFSLVVESAWNYTNLIDPATAAGKLGALENELPPEYGLAAREAVNNRNQRLLRGGYVKAALTDEPLQLPA